MAYAHDALRQPPFAGFARPTGETGAIDRAAHRARRPYRHPRLVRYAAGVVLPPLLALIAGAGCATPRKQSGSSEAARPGRPAATATHGRTPTDTASKGTSNTPGTARPDASPSTATPAETGASSDTPGVPEKPAFDLACTQTVARPDATHLLVTPSITIQGQEPQAGRLVAVADVFSGKDPNTFDHHDTYIGSPNAPMLVPVPANMNYPGTAVLVDIVYASGTGSMPSTPEDYSATVKGKDPGFVRFACGNAVIDYLLANGGIPSP